MVLYRDYSKVADVHFQAGLVPQNTSKEEFAQALRSVGEPIFGQSIKDISGGIYSLNYLRLQKNLICKLKLRYYYCRKLW